MKKEIIMLATVSFLLHLVWENLQAPLYGSDYISFAQHFPTCLIATFGDVFIALIVYYFIMVVKKDTHWIAKQDVSDYIAITFLGLLIAIGIEQNALLLEKWGYGATMPLIPYLRVGLLPILQMTILLPISFYLTKKLIRSA